MLKIPSNFRWVSEIPPLGFGCCPMGGHGWGRVNDAELREAVATALDLGVRLFDTSDVYGLGASETLLGKALRGRRDQAIIATKFGVRHENGCTFHDSSPAWITAAAEASLHRLGVNCIDLYQMHYWDGVTPMEQMVSALESLRKAGKIRAYGVTNYDPRMSKNSDDGGKIASYSYHYSLVNRQHEDLILTVQQQSDLLFMSWGSLGQGVLSGNYSSLAQLDPTDRRRRDVYENFHGEKFAAIQLLLEELKSIAAERGIPTVSQLALRWIADQIPRAIPLVGIKRSAQIIDAAGILRFKLDPATCARMERATRRFKLSTSSS